MTIPQKQAFKLTFMDNNDTGVTRLTGPEAERLLLQRLGFRG